MKYDLSNRVIARFNERTATYPNRSLDLGNIITPELGLLSPNRNEIAPRGGGREAALLAYSERLRNSYKQNEGGLREGMVKLGEAFRNGQSISITCFCRAGQMCHADVVKLAIEKVAKAIDSREQNRLSRETVVQDPSFRPSNPRTERAINEILSFSKSDIALSKLDDTDGRNPSAHASYLNRQSQFLRDMYERGGTVKNGVLVIPKDIQNLQSPLHLTTAQYGLKILEPLLGAERTREIVPQILQYGKTIAGSNADRETEVKVFRWMYDALDAKHELLEDLRESGRSESPSERFEKVMSDIGRVADEMGKLESCDRFEEFESYDESRVQNTGYLPDAFGEHESSIENREPQKDSEHVQATVGFERIELDDASLHAIASEMSAKEFQHWAEVKLPALDEALENGISPSTIVKLFRARSNKTMENGVKGKELNYEDLRFATAYLEHQLKQPETRLRHFNERYRDYAQMLDQCKSRDEVMEVSSKIRIENAAVGISREPGIHDQNTDIAQGLTSKELQMLFTEQSPRHYTSEMIATKLNYAGNGVAAKAKTEALIRGEIAPSPEAQELIESLESRMERRYLGDSLSATKHFLQSLKTPNEELRFRNNFDHSQVYRKLPPAERDFVYQQATSQKNQLEKTAQNINNNRERHGFGGSEVARPDLDATKLRDVMKTEMLALSIANADPKEVQERTSSILTDHLKSVGFDPIEKEAAQSLSNALSEIIWGRDTQLKSSRSEIHSEMPRPAELNSKNHTRDIPIAHSR